MPYYAKVYNVMIASPGDVKSEREIAQEVIMMLNTTNAANKKIVLLPISWETHSSPELGAPPQEIINKQVLKNSDILIGIFWSKFGTPTDNHDSGTVEEIEKHKQAGKITMVYFSSRDIPRNTAPEQIAKIDTFKRQLQSRGLYAEYSTEAEFREKLTQHLLHKLNELASDKELDKPKNEETFDNSVEDLPELAKEIIKDLAQSNDGNIIIVSQLGGQKMVRINGKDYSPRNLSESVELEDALEKLQNRNFIKYESKNQYKVTFDGLGYGKNINI